MQAKERGNPNWVKGISGNPAGRPRQPAEMLMIARAASPEAFKRVCALMKSKNEAVALAAAREVLDRAWGKPSQEATVNLRHGDITEWSRAEILDRLAELRERRDEESEQVH